MKTLKVWLGVVSALLLIVCLLPFCLLGAVFGLASGGVRSGIDWADRMIVNLIDFIEGRNEDDDL